jgi:hypothetical protein
MHSSSQWTVCVVLGVWLSLLGHTCHLGAVCFVSGHYLLFKDATHRQRVVFFVDGCVVEGLCCRSSMLYYVLSMGSLSSEVVGGDHCRFILSIWV